MKKVAVIGLGYVGLTTALLFANTGMDVLCIDEDEDKVKLLKNKKMPFYEKGCDKLLKKILINYILPPIIIRFPMSKYFSYVLEHL